MTSELLRINHTRRNVFCQECDTLAVRPETQTTFAHEELMWTSNSEERKTGTKRHVGGPKSYSLVRGENTFREVVSARAQ